MSQTPTTLVSGPGSSAEGATTSDGAPGVPLAKPGTRTVGCSLERLVADPTHLERLRDAVGRVHKATTLNRDRNGATNIGANFKRLMGGLPPLRATTDEDLAFLRASVCVECD